MEIIQQNENNETDLEVFFLLDKSGSMHGSVDDTIGGFNSYLDEQRNNGFETRITTILFDTRYEILYERKDVKDVKDLTTKEYRVGGCTALLDAIGNTFTSYGEDVKDKKVLFVIITDGYENSSREFSKSQIKDMIEKHENWEVIYLGADIDSYTEASSFGITRDRTANYQKSGEGFKEVFRSVSNVSDMRRFNRVVDSSWKEELEKYD